MTFGFFCVIGTIIKYIVQNKICFLRVLYFIVEISSRKIFYRTFSNGKKTVMISFKVENPYLLYLTMRT